MEEIYLKIPNYDNYSVSNLGNIKSNHSGIEKLLSKRKSGNGYVSVLLYKKGFKPKTINIHQLVAICFLNHKIDGYNRIIDHKNKIRNDNRVENLQIISPRENVTKEILKKNGYCGMTLEKSTGKYMVRINKNKKSIYIGRYNSINEAQKAYNNAIK
jgi:hypothetical protein